MSEKQQTVCDPFDYLADAFWASLPEESANELADFKKRELEHDKDDDLDDDQPRKRRASADGAKRGSEIPDDLDEDIPF